MSVKRLPMIIDCDRIWADLVTVLYRLQGKPRVTYFVPPLPETPRQPEQAGKEST